MHSRSNWLALAAGIFFLISPVGVEALDPLSPPSPPPSPTPPSSVRLNPDQSIPVVISHGQNHETRARIYRGVMDPVGMLPSQIVTVTVFFPANWAGQPVRFGLYDGGQVGQAAPPNTPIIALNALLHVVADGTAQFNFRAGRTLGLYRLLVTVGADQYLLQFSAGTPRSSSGLPPLPSPNLSPVPPPSPLPTPPPTKAQ